MLGARQTGRELADELVLGLAEALGIAGVDGHVAGDAARALRCPALPDDRLAALISPPAAASPPLLRNARAQCATALGGYRAGWLLNHREQPLGSLEPERLLWIEVGHSQRRVTSARMSGTSRNGHSRYATANIPR